jgi:competence protein ComFC
MWLRNKLTYFFKALFDFLFPPICLGCDKEIETGLICYQCSNQISTSALGVCARCGYPLKYDERCKHCRTNVILPRTRALGFYSEPFPPLIHALKYQGKKSLAEIFGKGLTGLLNSDPVLKQADAIIPIPLHPARQRERGYNQTELLAIELSRQTGIPIISTLKRKKNTKSQTILDPDRRQENMRGAFVVKNTPLVLNKKVILIDDVMTSGATISSAAQTLSKAGADEVYGLVIARA